jgi:hypothetical protein
MHIVSNCFICEQPRSLHIVSVEGGLQQCLYCGYATSDKFIITDKKENNKEYQMLHDMMKKWSKTENNKIWIPSILTLPTAMIYPIEDDGLKWSYAELIDIQENEKERYKNPNGGYFKQKYNTENAKIFDEFYLCLYVLNTNQKDKIELEQLDFHDLKSENKEITLPKLKKISGT